MKLQKISTLPGNKFSNGEEIKLRVPITIVSDDESCYTPCQRSDGGYYMRRRRNYYHESEWNERVNTFVKKGQGDEICEGLSYMYFSFGDEGSYRTMIGMPSDEYERELSKRSHRIHHKRHCEQMERNNRKYQVEKNDYRPEYEKMVLAGYTPKVLLFDLETAPMVSYHWRRYKENIGIDQTISESFIICYSAKWLYSSEVMGDCCTSKEMKDHDDMRVCESLWRLIDAADVVIAHNGLKADVPWMNSRFIVNGMVPPSSYIAIDTLQIAKKKFGFSSNKLDALAGYFGIDHKLDTNFGLWRDCMEGKKEALDYMYEYNQKDVEILEDVYVQLRPWAGNLIPNMGRFVDKDICPVCGNEEYELLEGKYYVTPCHKYQLYRCKGCGAVFHGRVPVLTTKNIFTSCAR